MTRVVSRGATNNKPALLQIMIWRRTSEQIVAKIPVAYMYICITRPQWLRYAAVQGSICYGLCDWRLYLWGMNTLTLSLYIGRVPQISVRVVKMCRPSVNLTENAPYDHDLCFEQLIYDMPRRVFWARTMCNLWQFLICRTGLQGVPLNAYLCGLLKFANGYIIN